MSTNTMDSQVLKALEENKKLLNDIQAKNEERAEQISKTGEDLNLVKGEVHKMAEDFMNKLTVLERAATRMASSASSQDGNLNLTDEYLERLNNVIQKTYNKNNTPEFNSQSVEQYGKFFEQYLRYGDKAAFNPSNYGVEIDTKMLAATNDPAGGYLVVPQYDPTILAKQFDNHAIAEFVAKQTTSGEFKEILDWADYADAYFSNELDSASTPANNEKFTEITWNNKEVIYSKKFSRTALEDSFINVEAHVLGKMREGAIRTLANNLVNGNGSACPRGILTYPAGTGTNGLNNFGQIQQVTSNTSGKVTWYDVMFGLPSALKDPYHKNAKFAMARAAFFGLLVEVDVNGRYQLNQMVNFFQATGFAMNILGYPVGFEAYMPAIASGSLSVGFGDFDQAYLLTETPAVSLIRDETQPKYVTIHQRNRYDGKVRNFDAYKLLATHA